MWSAPPGAPLCAGRPAEPAPPTPPCAPGSSAWPWRRPLGDLPHGERAAVEDLECLGHAALLRLDDGPGPPGAVGEGAAVPGKHQLRGQLLGALQPVEVLAQRVVVEAVVEVDGRCDPGQEVAPGEEDPLLRAPQAQVDPGVPRSEEHLPLRRRRTPDLSSSGTRDPEWLR